MVQAKQAYLYMHDLLIQVLKIVSTALGRSPCLLPVQAKHIDRPDTRLHAPLWPLAQGSGSRHGASKLMHRIEYNLLSMHAHRDS
jgi:hypothetical protein